jgi:phosphotransferase family enzyme
VVLDVPRSWQDFSPEWMTAAISRHHAGAVVGSVSVGDVADGTNRRARIRLDYESGEGPASVFVKAHGRMLNRLALVALRALEAEAHLAESGVALPLETPEPYAAAVNRRRLEMVVVTEDITLRGGHPNDAATPLDPAEVRSGLDGLARLHAAYWDRPLPPSLSFLRPWRLTRAWTPVSALNLARGLRRVRESGPADLIPRSLDARTLEAQFRMSAKLAATGPQTVLHGDPHPGNTYAMPGSLTGFYDWQLVRTGHWSHDVGYFLAGSLTPEDRRRHERDLLSGYLDSLGQAGAKTAPSFDEAWDRYRATPAFGLCTWLHTIAAGSFQPIELCVSTLERFAAAYQDLRTADLLNDATPAPSPWAG